jgi:hypothetical protein
MKTAPPQIEIDGKFYPGPTLDDLSFDEMEVAVSLGCPVHPDGTPEISIHDIRWVRAMVVIALERANEDSDIVGEIKVNDVHFHGYQEANGGPPPNRASRRASNGAKPATGKRSRGAQAGPRGSSGQ